MWLHHEAATQNWKWKYSHSCKQWTCLIFSAASLLRTGVSSYISMHSRTANEAQIGEHKSQRKTNTDTHCTRSTAVPAPVIKLLLLYLPWHNITGQLQPAQLLMQLVFILSKARRSGNWNGSRLFSWGGSNWQRPESATRGNNNIKMWTGPLCPSPVLWPPSLSCAILLSDAACFDLLCTCLVLRWPVLSCHVLSCTFQPCEELTRPDL